MATRRVSRTPSPLVSAKCLRLNVLLLVMLLLPLFNCTKPVIVPLLMMLVLLLLFSGLPATARSDNAPMLPSLVSVAVPLAELKITPAAGRPGRPSRPKGLEPTLVRSACQPPFTDPPTLTVTSPPPVALIAVLNCPVVDTFIALTCTVLVVELAQMPCEFAPCVEIAPNVVTLMGPPAPGGAPKIVALIILPLSARMPSAPEPVVVIGPTETTLMLPLPERAAMPMPFPPWVVMLPALLKSTEIGASKKLDARMPIPLLRGLGSAAAGPSIWIVDDTSAVNALPAAAVPPESTAIPGFKGSPVRLVTLIMVPGSVVTVADAPVAKMPLEKIPLTSIVPLW